MIMFDNFDVRFFHTNRAIGNFISITVFTKTSMNGVQKAYTKNDRKSIFVHANY